MAQMKTWHTYWCLWWQTSNQHHCNWYAQKPIDGDFQLTSSSSSWSKATLCIFQEKTWLPNRKCHGKKLWFDQKELLKMAFCGEVMDVLRGKRIKFHLGRTKERGKRGYGERSPKWGGFFCKFPLLSKIQTLSHKLLVKLLTTTSEIGMPKHLHAGTFKWFWTVLSGQKQLCVFLRNKYGLQMLWKNTLFCPGRNAQNGLVLLACRFWTCRFQWHKFWGCPFRYFWVMGYMHVLSWKLLIIGPLLEYFATLLKKLHLKKIATNCSIFLDWLYFFLMGRSGTFLEDKDQISSWRTKGRGKRGYGKRSPKWGGFFCKIPTIKQDTNFMSQTVHQTNF